jgi:single-strand DNA-binding protein
MNYQKLIAMGRLGRDPDIKQLPTGTSVCTFSVAVSETYKDQKHTEWLNVETWGKVAESCARFLRKGSGVMIEGKLKTQSWGEGDQKKYKTVVVAQNVQFISPRQEDDDAPKTPPTTTAAHGYKFDDAPSFDDSQLDNIPF